ncbi:MAG: hypothetical protein ACTSPB_26455, partial [Candidatus Thorarchaeota archaeon]
AKYIKGTGRRGKRGPVRILSQEEVNDYTFKRKIQMAEKKRSERTMRTLAFLFDETYRTGKWIGTEDVAKHLDIPRSSTSGLLTTISKKMHDSIELMLDNKKILRQMKDDCPFSSAREFVEEYYRRSGKKGKRRVKVRPKPIEPKPIEPKPIEPKPTKTRDAMQRALRFLYAKGNAEGDEGWIESSDVAEALGITLHSASGLVSRIDTRMRDLMIIENIGVGKQKKYKRRLNLEFVRFENTEQFVEEFYKRGPAFDKKVEPTAEVEPIVEVEPEAKVEADDIDQSLKELEKEVREGVGEIAKQATEAIAKILNTVDRRVDLNLKVTGEVKFRFLFGENK